jgi:hypothetical protein
MHFPNSRRGRLVDAVTPLIPLAGAHEGRDEGDGDGEDETDRRSLWIEPVQLRRVWSNVGALNLNRRVHSRVELWDWSRPAAELSDRWGNPWDAAKRRRSHVDRRKTWRRAMLEDEFQHGWIFRQVLRTPENKVFQGA